MRRLRAVLHWGWPLLAAVAVAAVIVAATVAIWSIFDQRSEEMAQRERLSLLAADVKRLAEEAKTASEANNAILAAQERRDIERQPLIDAAIKRIVDDNAEAHAALLGQIARILNRPVPTAPPRPASTSPTTVAPRVAPPRPPAAPPPTTTTPRPAPVTTPTTCPKKGKSGVCR